MLRERYLNLHFEIGRCPKAAERQWDGLVCKIPYKGSPRTKEDRFLFAQVENPNPFHPVRIMLTGQEMLMSVEQEDGVHVLLSIEFLSFYTVDATVIP